MTIEAVCFDLDDTLYDYLRYARAGLDAAGDYLEELTGERYHAELYDIYFEDENTTGTFDVLIERHDLDPELVDELVEAYHGSMEPIQPYPETERVLSELGETYELGCITDGREGHSKLHRLGIRWYFDAVLVTPTTDHSKDNPAVFERVLSELSVSPEEAVYVGDDPRSDFRTPNELGMTTVRLRRGRYTDLEPADDAARPDYEIEQLERVPSVIVAEEYLSRRVGERHRNAQ